MATNTYTIPLKHLFKTNKERRAKKAIREIRRFLAKHKRLDEEKIVIAGEVNKEVWKKGMYGIPRKIEVELMEEEEKTIVFLKGGKEG
ncbi:60S ribosomal protein L31, partial [Candidatus Micrarchaeota archaeon]|nr:60S ribosomal protein L31 [Candidatus Micrarchaeota archaeon]